jgi:hypothetical protein
MSIYLEIVLGGPLERSWRTRRCAALDQQWDLRFSRIEYLPRPRPGATAMHATRLGFGVEVRDERTARARRGENG